MFLSIYLFKFYIRQLVGLLSKIEKAIVETAGIGWGHCAPSACTKADFYNNYKVKIKFLNKFELIFMSQLPKDIFFGHHFFHRHCMAISILPLQ